MCCWVFGVECVLGNLVLNVLLGNLVLNVLLLNVNGRNGATFNPCVNSGGSCFCCCCDC